MILYLVRHPQPAVAHGLCYGATDVAVNESEFERVHAALKAAELPGDLPVFSSPLRRCAELARRLRPQSLQFDRRLAEMNFGAWEMRAWSDIPRVEVDAWAADPALYRPGGGENVLDVALRVAAFIDELRDSVRSDALVICHAGTIRLLTALCAGLSPAQAALRAAATPHRIGYGELIVLGR